MWNHISRAFIYLYSFLTGLFGITWANPWAIVRNWFFCNRKLYSYQTQEIIARLACKAMTSTGHGSPGQPPKNCSRRFCQSWGKRADPTACARRSAGQSWRKRGQGRASKKHKQERCGTDGRRDPWCDQWEATSKAKGKSQSKNFTKKAAAKPTVQPEEPPSKKSKATFPFPGEGPGKPIRYCNVTIYLCPKSPSYRVKLAGEKKDKTFTWKMDGPKQAWSRVRQRVLSVSVWRLASHKALAEARPEKISWPAGHRAAGKTACEAATTVPRPSFACFFSRLSCYIFGQPSCYILVNPRAATWLLKVLEAKWT